MKRKLNFTAIHNTHVILLIEHKKIAIRKYKGIYFRKYSSQGGDDGRGKNDRGRKKEGKRERGKKKRGKREE